MENPNVSRSTSSADRRRCSRTAVALGVLSAVALLVVLSAVQTMAADISWRPDAGSGRWYTTGNWSPSQRPGGGDHVFFTTWSGGTNVWTTGSEFMNFHSITFSGEQDFSLTTERLFRMDGTDISVTGGNGEITLGPSGRLFQLYSTSPITIENNSSARLTLPRLTSYGRTSGSVHFRDVIFTGSGDITFDSIEFRSGGHKTDVNLVKNGAGTLTIKGPNLGNVPISGKTTINDGAVVIGGENYLGANPSTFVADQLKLDGGTLRTNASFALQSNRGMTLGSNGGTLSPDAGTTLTVANPITGAGGLTKAGEGTLILTGVNDYTLIEPAAAAALNHYGSRSPGRTIDGSGMDPNNPVVVSSTAGTAPDGNMWLSGKTSGQNWIAFDLASETTIAGFHVWNYNEGGSATGSGTKDATVRIGTDMMTGSYADAGNWGTAVQDVELARASGDSSYTGESIWFADGTVDTRYIALQTHANHGGSSGRVGLSEIRFFGLLPWTGANTYTGGTTVESGTLLVNNTSGSGTGSGPVTVQGGTLGGTGTIGGHTTIGELGVLSPGDGVSAGNGIGTLSFAPEKSLTLDAGAAIDWQFLSNTEAGESYDHLVGDALYLPDAEGAIGLNIFGLDGYSLSAGDSFTLFSGDVYDGSTSTLFEQGQDITHRFDIASDVDWWGTWEVTAGSLVLTAVPEPGTLLTLLSALACGLLVRRRRTG